MLDFTSALYLGFQHPSRSLRPWERLSVGVPAALAEPPVATDVAQTVAAQQGLQAATLATSTLHLFWDLFGVLGGDRDVSVLIDAGAYPIARWGVERAAHRGVPVRPFDHHDVDQLTRRAGADARRGLRPVVVTDGVCPRCGRPAPLRAYLDVARRADGIVVVDDTQALGVLGVDPGPSAPYGRGGGGSPRWHRVDAPELVVVASLAKGFGVPLAALSGTRELVRRFEAGSETRVHCSPPSVANLRAAEHALTLNRRRGDALRLALARLVAHFRWRLAEFGLRALGGLFPVQTLAPARGLDPAALHGALLARGVATVLHRARPGGGPRLSVLITARHRPAEICVAIDAIAATLARPAALLEGSI